MNKSFLGVFDLFFSFSGKYDTIRTAEKRFFGLIKK